ncbi:MAG: hypothetical protein Q9183_002149 [Haloplaca sp. 2 TL-2023]
MKFLDGGYEELQLDIVGFLAILGESSVLVQSQVAALSKFFLLPRLLPAPQALIRTTRPERLEPSTGKVVGAHSGVLRDHVNHLAHLLHSNNNRPLPAYSVTCKRITWNPGAESNVDARPISPMSALSVLGCVMSIALLVLAIRLNDGFALLAVLALSFLSTIIGIANRWFLKLPKRDQDRPVPPADVVICYPNGAFLIIKCTEEIARELYWHPDECIYWVNDSIYRLISLLGTLILMFGVICLGNATLDLQLGFAASYIILNAAYWAVAALNPQRNWNLTRYSVHEVRYDDGAVNKTFTAALWKAIAATQSVHWARVGRIPPSSRAWDKWLDDAEREAKTGGPAWDEKGDEVKHSPDWQYDVKLSEYLAQPGSPTDYC